MSLTFRSFPLFPATFLVLVWLSGCAPARHFDYKTSGGFDQAATATSSAQPEEMREPTLLLSEPQRAAAALAANLPKPNPPRTHVANSGISTKKEGGPAWKDARKEVKREWKTQRKELKKTLRQVKKMPADHPLNDGITAALLILGLGVLLLVAAALLPSLISVIGWILGIAVLLIGVVFLVLTLLGFDVRIIG